jgi:hypothetical protein
MALVVFLNLPHQPRILACLPRAEEESRLLFWNSPFVIKRLSGTAP